MKTRFKYDRDKQCRRLTAVWIGIIAVAVVIIALLGGSGYMQAWLYSVLVAVTALYALSIPRYVSVDRDNLEIHCVVEMTRIDIRDVALVRKVDMEARRGRLWLVLGSYGFFGYFGYYFDWRNWEMVKVYATERAHFVEIEDIYEQKYLVSYKLIEAVMRAKAGHSGAPGTPGAPGAKDGRRSDDSGASDALESSDYSGASHATGASGAQK